MKYRYKLDNRRLHSLILTRPHRLPRAIHQRVTQLLDNLLHLQVHRYRITLQPLVIRIVHTHYPLVLKLQPQHPRYESQHSRLNYLVTAKACDYSEHLLIAEYKIRWVVLPVLVENTLDVLLHLLQPLVYLSQSIVNTHDE